jgi:hypothetical protein
MSMIQNKSQKVKWVCEFHENTKNSINRISRKNLIGSHTIILQKILSIVKQIFIFLVKLSMDASLFSQYE